MKVFGFTGRSGSGKTTLIENLIPIFVGLQLRVSVIKHTHHDFDVDRPGKDSWRHREAGAKEVLLTSDRRWVLMHELRGQPEPTLLEQMGHLAPCDLVLVEGFKQQRIPKLEVWRSANDTPLLQPTDANVVAIAADIPLEAPVPVFGIGDHKTIVNFILATLGLSAGKLSSAEMALDSTRT